MQTINAIEMINGSLKRTETNYYPSSGMITKRVFDRPGDIQASDVITIRVGKRVGPVAITEPPTPITRIG